MIEKFCTKSLIIDNTKDEIKNLKKFLYKNNIYTKYINPNKYYKKINDVKIIFLDLHLLDTENTSIEGHISFIRKMFIKLIGKNYGTYGIIMWTCHDEETILFKEKIKNDEEYDLPIFIIGLDKNKYLKSNLYDNIFNDIDSKLEKDIAANFYINWNLLVNNSVDRAIRNIYSLVPDYTIQGENLEFLLYKMAQKYTGNLDYNMKEYSFKAFSELLLYEIIKESDNFNFKIFDDISNIKYTFEDNYKSKYFPKDNYFKIGDPADKIKKDDIQKKLDNLKNKTDFFNEIENKFPQLKDLSDFKNEKAALEQDKEKTKNKKDKLNTLNGILYNEFAKLNTISLLDEIIANEREQKIMPGNIYLINNKKDNLLISKKFNTNDIPIAIELTPPCDYSNSKNGNPKLIGGFITKYSENRLIQLKGLSFYSELHPLKLPKYFKNELAIIIFDFKCVSVLNETDLKNNYQLIFKTKNILFADVLQKFSSYSSRLGLPKIH